jgi:hypothetical protein
VVLDGQSFTTSAEFLFAPQFRHFLLRRYLGSFIKSIPFISDGPTTEPKREHVKAQTASIYILELQHQNLWFIFRVLRYEPTQF